MRPATLTSPLSPPPGPSAASASPSRQNNKITLLGLELPLPADTTFVASLRYAGALHLRIDQILPSESEAAQSTRQLNQLLNLLRNLQLSQQPITHTPEDAAVHQLTDSILIEQHHDRATLTATIPTDTLKHLTP